MYARHLRTLALALAVALLSLPGRSAAQTEAIDSPRDWFLGLQIGGYFPAIDDEFDGARPFENTFGDDQRLLFQVGVERFLFKDFGTVGLGLSAGYSEFFAHAFFDEDRSTRSEDPTSMQIVPIQAYLAYRFDVASVEWGFPLVPYAKAGAGYWLWWTGDKNGARAGYTFSGGLQLLLDVFDKRLAREFDREIGVNNSYLYVDWTWSKVNGFGTDGFDLSDSSMVSGGLAFDF